jgi:Vitamin K-dependent gamma-carboxylase
VNQTPRAVDVRSGFWRRAVQAWDRFWFAPADPTPLGLIRICCGLVVLYTHFAYTYDLYELFGKHGWLDLQTVTEFRKEAPIVAPSATWQDPPPEIPRTPEEVQYAEKWGVHPKQTTAKGRWIWSIWLHVTDPTAMAVVHGCALLAIFLFTIGLATRVTGVLTWAAMLSYIQRSPITLFGMDTIMIVVVLYLVLGPSGAALSVDRLVARYLATLRALRKHQPPPVFDRPAPRVSANLALRLMQVHVCIIYFVSGLSKLQGDMWWSGTAVWATMANYEFSPIRYGLYVDFLKVLVKSRLVWETVITGLTLGTLAFEISFPFLVWSRSLRWTMVLAAVALHTGIAFFMGLVTFSLMMLTLVLAFVPAAAMYKALWWLGRGRAGLRLAPVPA